MKRKSTFISFLLLFWTIYSYSQTYFNPRESIDINITVKEPFKPISYSEIGQNFNNAIQKVIAERNARKKYYQDIYYQTKSSINSNTVLTNEYEIDQLIFNLQENFNYRIDSIYSQLTSGRLKENLFESNLSSTYSAYLNANRSLAYLSRFKYQNQSNQNFQILFKKVLNHVKGFNVTRYGNVSFTLSGIKYVGSNNVSSILNYVSEFSTNINKYENAISIFKKEELERFKKKEKLEGERIWRLAQKKLAIKNKIEGLNRFIAKREEKILKLPHKEKKKYLQAEFRHYKKSNNDLIRKLPTNYTRVMRRFKKFKTFDSSVLLSVTERIYNKSTSKYNDYTWKYEKRRLYEIINSVKDFYYSYFKEGVN